MSLSHAFAKLTLCPTAPGIYVEIALQSGLDRVWELTQQPALHQRWDLRFTQIEYLPRLTPEEPQRFLYETRIGFGLAVRGTGKSIGERRSADGTATSSLKFASDDAKSIIRVGSGYWRYVPTASGVRFFTWYDYSVRFGLPGRLADRLLFRPLMGWATAWSFDRLRLWADEGQTPETSLAFALTHAIARVTIACVWIWHGLVPKLLFHHADEQTMLTQTGGSLSLLPWAGAGEIVFGLLILLLWNRRSVFLVNAALMIFALAAVAVCSPAFLRAAFNPVTLNLCMVALSIVGWIASRTMPSATRCLRTAPKGQA